MFVIPRSSNFHRADSDDLNESHSTVTEDNKEEEEAESDFEEDHVDVVKVTTGDLGKNPVKKTEKKKASILGAFYQAITLPYQTTTKEVYTD